MGISGHLSSKNVLWIAATLEELREEGVEIALLNRVCQSILGYAESFEGD